MALAAETLADVDAILTGLADARLARRWAYFSGEHPQWYVTPKLRHMFAGLAERLTENYCALAVGSRVSRLEVTGWAGDGAELAQATWDDQHWPTRQNDLYRWGLVYGRGYLIGYRDPSDQEVTLAPSSPAWTYGVPEDDDPSALELAGKLRRDHGRWRLTLWDDDGWVRRLVGPAINEQTGLTLPRPDDFAYDPDEPEVDLRIDHCPVRPISPYGLDAPPLLDQIAPIQDRINKLSANKLVAAEFGAFRQRVFFTRQDVTPGDIANRPDHAIVLDPGEAAAAARVQELQATDLANYDQAKQAEVNALFTIASLPRHMMVNPGAVASGEAIKADESPFIEALHDHQREFGESLQASLADLGILDAEPVWRDVEPRNDASIASTVKTMIDAGLPWQVVVSKYAAWSAEEVAEAETSMGVAASQGQASLTGILTGLGNGMA